ncbi:hypothetical protein BLS_003182 [Venturia inaequalis]|uniref:Uncharacterized protein n=1 Tax=Venturia inaequalis TaxID=5025 RepID=A0A8H3ZBB6_VENIN|nr:hypothetical protein BLS_003182 [Venturia inaequalis]KAE9993190.1 hypothetical protein EG327_006189 [Venturia inaequalis]
MQYSTILLASLAVLASASPAIDPLTLTSLSPAQETAYASANEAYLESLTADPAFASLLMNLASDTTALAAFTSAAGALASVQPGQTDGIAQASSVINQLPSSAAAFYNSVLSMDIAIASSVVNNVDVASGSSMGSASQAAAPTNVVLQAAGVAIGAFGVVVAML